MLEDSQPDLPFIWIVLGGILLALCKCTHKVDYVIGEEWKNVWSFFVVEIAWKDGSQFSEKHSEISILQIII